MIFSEEKKLDMQNRLLMLEAIEIAIRNEFLGFAKEIGEHSKKLAQKIKTKNYTI